jgi:hypothetical protein
VAEPNTPEPRSPEPRTPEPRTPELRTPELRTYDELVASKTGALRRLYTIVCVIILEILQRMAMMDNPNLKPLPSTVLARAIAGDSFGLPAPLAATLRLLARELRRWAEPPAPQQAPTHQQTSAPDPQRRSRRQSPLCAPNSPCGPAPIPSPNRNPVQPPRPAHSLARFFKNPKNPPRPSTS